MGTMKRFNSKQEPVVASGNSLVASAARVKTTSGVWDNTVVNSTDRAWQQSAYSMYKQIGEFRYSCDWVGSMMSKAKLFATHREPGGAILPLKDGTPVELVDSLFNDPDGRAAMLKSIGVHMTIAGECFLVGYDNPDIYADDPYVWETVAPTSLKNSGPKGKWMINQRLIDIPGDDVIVIRIWNPDPEDSELAMAPSRALLPVLGEILRLTQHVAAQVDSRLAGAGILLVPSEMTFPPPPEGLDAEGEVIYQHHNDAESLMETLTEAMAASIKDRGSASALVPIVITAPAETIEKIQHLTFWSDLDAQAIELRKEAIGRLALGMDMPPEVLQGTADSNHWAAWQADESAIKAHTEPLLKLISSALSQGYLRPLLHAEGYDRMTLREFSIGADTSDMRLRPNRSEEAFKLYEHGAISEATLRRETGFTDDDEMNEKERIVFYLKKVASGSTTPGLVAGALKKLGVDLSEYLEDDEAEETQEARPNPSLKDLDDRGAPDIHEADMRARRAERDMQ